MSDFSISEEISDNVVRKNFLKSLELAKKWFSNISLESKGTAEYHEAKEAYLLCVTFNSRLEQIKKSPSGKSRAHFYLFILKKLYEMRCAEGFSVSTDGIIWRSFYYVLHKLSAKEFIFAFSGQEFHNLDPKEIIILVKSLIIIQNWTSSREVLLFYLRVNRLNPVPILLLSYVFASSGKIENGYIYLRNALLLQPEILKEFQNYFWIQDQYEDLLKEAEKITSNVQAKYRYFALLLELSVFTKYPIVFDSRDIAYIEQSFNKQHDLFLDEDELENGSKYRILHLLCWLIQYYQGMQDLDNIKRYKQLLEKIDSGILIRLEKMQLKHYNDFKKDSSFTKESS